MERQEGKELRHPIFLNLKKIRGTETRRRKGERGRKAFRRRCEGLPRSNCSPCFMRPENREESDEKESGAKVE